MGLIISRFRRKKTTIEILEDIDKEINRLQRNRKENQDRQKRIATGLIIYSIILYIISAIIFFLLYLPDTWPLRLLYSLPLLAFPFLIWGIKKVLHWYFVKRISGNDVALRDLRDKKKQILEDVMETETYKKAKEILEKFDPARFKKLEKDEQTESSSSTTVGTPGTALQQRKPASTPYTPQPQQKQQQQQQVPLPRPHMAGAGAGATPRPQAAATPNPFANTPLRAPHGPSGTPGGLADPSRGGSAPMQRAPMGQVPPAGMPPGRGPGYGPPGPPMPRSVLPRDRGTMDRLMDYLVGDGPENRYALICRACYSHNGMALREEFEFLSFRCCYCFVMNPARKQRPLAPRLEFFTPGGKTMTLTKPEESEDEEEEEEDSEEAEEEGKSESGGNPKAADAAQVASKAPPPASSMLSATPLSTSNKNSNARSSKLPVAGTKGIHQGLGSSASLSGVKSTSSSIPTRAAMTTTAKPSVTGLSAEPISKSKLPQLSTGSSDLVTQRSGHNLARREQPADRDNPSLKDIKGVLATQIPSSESSVAGVSQDSNTVPLPPPPISAADKDSEGSESADTSGDPLKLEEYEVVASKDHFGLEEEEEGHAADSSAPPTLGSKLEE